MEVSSSHQMYVFVLCILSGMVCGVFFDLQRFMRRVRFAGGVRTMLEDSIFVVICITLTIGMSFFFNNGEIRYYEIMGLVSGALFYGACLSRIVMKILQTVFDLIYRFIVKPLVKICTFMLIPFRKMLCVLKRLWQKIRKFFARFLRGLKTHRKRRKKRTKML
ncbi:MAG: spore cortex biosynthesis protein YabQ [Clostridia bacterium]|nr:spore cortex biosynthesis protein YabQ [Clostridia bacterium]